MDAPQKLILFIFTACLSFDFLYLVASAPASTTDVFISQCGFIENPIVTPAPSPPSPPLSPFTSPPPPSPPPLRFPPPPKNSSPPPPTCGTTANQKCGVLVPSFTYQPGFTFVGGFIRTSMGGRSASNCAWNCLSLANCVVFSHNVNDGSCSFQNSSAVPLPAAGIDSWQLCTATSGFSATKESFHIVGRRKLLQSGGGKQSPQVQLWSNSATWGNGIVPGIGSAQGVNVTIPCNTVVVLDLPTINVGLLRIQGLLRFLDDPSVPQIYVKANFILVEGQLFIGSASKPYSQKAIIELTPNTAGSRSPLRYTFAPPADQDNPRNLGHKAFAVVGGQVQLYGLPGSSSTPVWVRLSKDAYDDDTAIQVDANVAGKWPIGGQIVVTSSDYDRNQAETFTIMSINSTGLGQSIITLSAPLVNRHFGSIANDGYGNVVDERAEVLLLTRNIVITGTEEPSPYNLEGGHFVVYMTPYPPQYIEGVEFFKMGQQGTPQRYPLNFHILGASPGTFARKNAIHQSRQRCIVNRASHNILIDTNVAFNTSGHCFMLDEGGEQNNTFNNNIGALTNSAIRFSNDESDDRPSTFLISNLRNSFSGNVAAGSKENGFGFELRSNLRGTSATIPSINKTVPNWGTLTLFSNNIAHSNGIVGFKVQGLRPRVSANVFGPTNVLNAVRSFKNVWNGMTVSSCDSLLITNSVFADNGWGVQFSKNYRINVTDSKFFSLTNNFGSPSSCWDGSLYANCRPLSLTSCKMPLRWGTPGRSTGGRSRLAPTYGLLVDQNSFWDTWPYTFKNLLFTNYDPTCTTFAGLLTMGTGDWWNPGYSIEGLTFSSNSKELWFSPQVSQIYAWSTTNGGEQSQFYAIFDKDGSLVGSKGYLVANNTAILPPGQTGCVARPSWNAYACAGVCYRTVVVSYPEPGFKSNPANVNNTRDTTSYLSVTRVSDGSQFTVDGNMRDTNPNSGLRHYFFTVLAGQSYQIRVIPPRSRTFIPDSITASLRDVGECGLGLNLQFINSGTTSWRIPSSNSVYPRLCSGVSPFSPQYPTAQYSPICVNNEPWINIALSPGLTNYPVTPTINPYYITLVKQNISVGACSTSFSCSLLWSGGSWLYDDSGLERRPAFYNPIISKPGNWKTGVAPIGNIPRSTGIVTTISPPNATNLVTYYYRKNFNLTNIFCYTSLTIDIIIQDGIILYINNAEALRVNLLPGFVNNKTNALSVKPTFNWETYVIPINSSSPFTLVEGSNTVAVEGHMSRNSLTFSYDMRIQAIRSDSACNSSQVAKPEICDGLDNDLDGLVDSYANGSLLTAPCSTVCGTGIMTCIDGFFQGCTATPRGDELCDGIDNNCDGLIDNGNNQLNCSAGNVCFQGSCVAVLNATTPLQVWPKNATDWAFHDKGKDLSSLIPNWKSGEASDTCSCSSNATITNWLRGVGPLGYDGRDPPMPWQWLNTEINFFPANGKSFTAYFAKSFVLSSQEVNKTFNIDLSLRRVDGAIVYLNGVELWRDNVNWGQVLFSNTSSSYVSESQEKLYFPCKNCRRNNSALLRPGTNYIVAELHVAANWRRMATFDMDLYRNVIVPCPLSAPNCARQVEQQIIPSGSAWKYLDGTMAIPPSDQWMTPAFSDDLWLTGTSPLGYGSTTPKTFINNGSIGGSETRRAFYFRRWQNILEGPCYFQLNFNLLGKDGAAVYINGAEVYRSMLPSGPLNSTVTATGSAWFWSANTNATGGWLRKGMNLFAVEVHRTTNNASSVYFDLSLSGMREAITCSPDPSVVSIPWANI